MDLTSCPPLRQTERGDQEPKKGKRPDREDPEGDEALPRSGSVMGGLPHLALHHAVQGCARNALVLPAIGITSNSVGTIKCSSREVG